MINSSDIYINGKFLGQRTTGVQRFARGLLTALDELLVLNPEVPAPTLLTPPDVEVLQLQRIKQRACGRYRIKLTLWEQTVLPWMARDSVLLCLTGSTPLFGGVRIPTIHDAAVYLYPSAYSLVFRMWYRFVFNIVSTASPIVFTVSSSAAKELAQFLPDRNFKVIPNAADHILAVQADPSVLALHGLRFRKYLLAVGSHNPTKNLVSLVKAYQSSDLGADLPLVLVGGGNASVFTKGEFIESLPGLICTGPIADAALRALYEGALAFVFPSIYEGFGIPPLEAMKCGCPVLASNISSIREVCGEAAMYFDPYDKRSMIEALQAIAANEELRDALIKRGGEQHLCYSWSLSAKILLNQLQTVGLMRPNNSLSLKKFTKNKD